MCILRINIVSFFLTCFHILFTSLCKSFISSWNF
nr:MAG TPA: hypothetical protein [Bacteriophage sp.]